MQGFTETIYRIALHGFYNGGDFFGIYNGTVFEKGCLDPVDFKEYEDALTIAKIQCINVASDPEFSGRRVIAIDKFMREGANIDILPVAWIHIEGDGLNPFVEEIS